MYLHILYVGTERKKVVGKGINGHEILYVTILCIAIILAETILCKAYVHTRQLL